MYCLETLKILSIFRALLLLLVLVKRPFRIPIKAVSSNMTCLSTDMAEPVLDVVSLLLLRESTSCTQLGLRAGTTSTSTGLALASDLLR
jgi:hypothetical protein